MRNYLLYGLAAAILFALSASISLWLQNRNKGGADKGHDLAGADVDPGEARVLPRPARPDDSSQSAVNLRDRETALVQREKNLDVIARDLQKERAALEE